MDPTPDPSDLTLLEVSARLRVDPSTVSRWLTAGVPAPSGLVRLRGYRAGHRWRIPEAELAAFLNQVSPPGRAEPAGTQAQRGKRSRRAARQLGWE